MKHEARAVEGSLYITLRNVGIFLKMRKTRIEGLEIRSLFWKEHSGSHMGSSEEALTGCRETELGKYGNSQG